jgi:hypothetical protein
MSHVLMHESQVLRVRSGPLWLTREGDPVDHVLQAGQRLRVRRGERLWLGALHAHQPAQWEWEPAPAKRYALLRSAVGLAFGLSARALRGAADGLAALARSAASIASRAQGCIKAGDSIASAGTLQ